MSPAPSFNFSRHHAAGWLAAIIESSDDAIIGKDLSSIIHSWNKGAEKIFGYTAAEMDGTSIMRLIPADRQEEENHILNRIRRGEKVEHFETIRRTKAGRLLEVSITASPIYDGEGKVVGVSKIARDISVLKEREREIARMSRLYAALSQVNQAIVMLPARDQLFLRICQTLVEQGGFLMAWIGWREEASPQLVPVAAWGDKDDYIHSIKIYLDDRPEGSGPSGVAFRENRAAICNDLMTDPAVIPWREQMARRGLRALAVFPLRCEGRVTGTLNVYAAEAGFFQDKEIALLNEVAGDISFGLDNFVRREARSLAENKLRQERDFSESIINSLPGVLYLYNQEGRLLRWNNNFERVTGYNTGEVAAMHPLDFFAGADKEMVAARIRDVFAQGDSCVEAGLVTKSGREIPYYFTGVLTQFQGQTCLVGVGIDISARKAAEEAMRASEARYRALFEQAPDGILIGDGDGNYRDANASVCRMLGYTHDELVGLNAADIIAPEEAGRIAPVIREIREHADHHREWRFRRKDGSVFPVEVIASLMPDGRMLGMVRDITERTEAGAALRAAELRFHTLFDQTPVGVVVVDPGRATIIECNEQAAGQLGYTVGEFSRMGMADIEIEPAETQPRPWIAQLLKDGSSQFETRHRTKSGGIRDVFVSGRIMELAGRKLLHCVFVDITERKRAEAALRQLNETLEQKVVTRTEALQAALVRAEAADQVKSAFLATMSHELRTPLNSIIGFTGVVLKGLAGPLNAEQTKQLGMVRGSARHLLELINDVLDLSKIEAGQLEVHAEALDLPAVVERISGLVKPLADKKGLTLTVGLAPEIGEMVGDRRRLSQILLNLLNNAIKFTERGGVTFTVDLPAALRLTPGESPVPAVRFQVADTGLGIKPEDLDKLFLPFRQIDSGLTRAHEGTGLGLAICRRLAGLMGGTITVASEWGRGSVFTLTLPLKKEPPT